MTTIRWKWGARLLAVLAALLLAGGSAALAATLPAATGTLVGSTRTFELWAKASSTTLPNGAVVSVWGYTDSAGGTVSTPGGPMLIANVGETVVVNLTNTLPEASAMLFQGQDMIPDATGAAASGGTKSYTFAATSPGTFLYEAGLLPNSQHQAAMGLYGALIVRPATPNQAYADPATTFDDEVLLVVSEFDPAVSISPTGFDMRNYAPKYFLINGKAYPSTDAIPSAAGNRILFRYVNAGVQHHSMALLGLRQKIVAKDGSVLPTGNVAVVAEPLAPGQTADGIATVPAAATTASKFAVHDGSLMLHNNGAAGFGGMLTFVAVGAGTGNTGPATSAAVLTPSPTNGSVDVALSASVSDVASGNSNVVAAEYFIDSPGAAGTGTAMSGAWGTPTVAVSATLSAATLATLSPGKHNVYVHGKDDDPDPKWGGFNVAVLNLDKTGPATSALTLTPNPSNGTPSVALSGTANDSASGGSNITAAEYTIDGGAPIGMTMVGAAAPVRSVTATVAAATVGALPEGAHVVSVRSQDALGNWGAPTTINLVVDKSGPATSGVTATPNPNNGALPFSSSSAVVRVTASFSDALANVAAAEGFIDTVGANGTGFSFIPSDASFNSASENGYADIPLTTINALSAGNHTIYVHGKDAAGNWGATGTVVLLIDKTAPTFASISLTPNPTNGATSVTLTVNGASDVGGAGVAGGEYWINPPTTTAPAPGGGTQFSGLTPSIPIGALATGTYTVSARIRDAAGNWSTGAAGIRSATLTVVPDAIFANGFETGSSPWGWSSASTSSTTRLNVTTTPALVGSRSLQAQGSNTNYVQYNFGTAANPASATYDARFYFRPNGNTSTGKDILSTATTSGFGTTVFRVRYRLNAGTPQVQIQVGTANTNTTWTPVLGGTSNNVIEVVWQSGTTLQLYVNGVLSQTLTAGAGSVGAVRLGSVTNTGNATLMYFDAFESKRSVSPLIGP